MTPTSENTASSQTISGQGRSGRRYFLAAILLAGVFAGLRLKSLPIRLQFPGELDVVEGIPLAEMVHLRQGIPIYAPPSLERFDAAIYGPLYYLLGAQLIDPDAPLHFSRRVLSFFATLGCAAGCGVLTHWLTGKLFAAVLAPLIFLSYGIVTSHGISARCDAVALCLVFWGFLVAFRFRKSPLILLAIPLMTASFFYKQQYVAAPLAVASHLVIERRYRLAAAFAGLMGGSVLSLLALFQFVVFQGQDFFLHFFHFNLIDLTWPKFEHGLFGFGMLLVVPLLVGLEALRARRETLVSCYLLFAVVLALIALAKIGSDSNYYLESVLLLSALFATTFAERIGQVADAGALLALLGMAIFLGQSFSLSIPSVSDFEKDREIQAYLRHNFPARTIALGDLTGDLLRAGFDVPTNDIHQYSHLVRKGTLADDGLMAALDSHKFGAIGMRCDLEGENPRRSCVARFLTRRVAGGIVRNYRLAATLELPSTEKFGPEDQFHVWVPKGINGGEEQSSGP